MTVLNVLLIYCNSFALVTVCVYTAYIYIYANMHDENKTFYYNNIYYKGVFFQDCNAFMFFVFILALQLFLYYNFL